MQDIVRPINECRVCGHNDWLDVVSFGSTPLAGNLLGTEDDPRDETLFPLDVGVCRKCWLMTLRHVIEPNALFGHYRYVASDAGSIIQHMRQLVELCIRWVGLTDRDLVVEFGSNTGAHLELFQQAGMRVVGVDPARNLADIANDRGVTTIPAGFTTEVGQEITTGHGPARLVFGRQCFAHIHDVHEVLDGVSALLAPDGLFFVEVPYLVELLANNQFDTIFHEHLSYFSLGALCRLFEAHGLRVVDVHTVDVHGGSIVVFAAPATAGYEVRPAVAEMLAEERSQGIAEESTYQKFAERTERVRAQIRELVRSLVADGKTVAGYGAPTKGSALLTACGLGHQEIRFCSDTTALKQGKLLPGSRVPIWSPEQASDHVPDYYLLLAWNYASEIITKEKSFLEGGGRFIVPIPEPRVISAESAW
ncbi:class I SAM-dependent methyltransferase [Streptomyces rishiriensis]|uniref:C-methyltransferase n=1 Tax=Streptomyces rishiriensis TaxID=68264 RepID=Q9F8S9_STRRH|nr:C-methyltransferase [Streptomyces rishiriensis]